MEHESVRIQIKRHSAIYRIGIGLAIAVAVTVALLLASKSFVAVSVSLIVVVSILAYISSVLSRNEIKRRFSKRKEYSFNALYKDYFAEHTSDEELVRRVLESLSTATGVPLGRMRPTDRLYIDFEPVHSFLWIGVADEVYEIIKHELAHYNRLMWLSYFKHINTIEKIITYIEGQRAQHCKDENPGNR